MRVLLLQLDGKFPNLALMALAAHHRQFGDDVELRQCRVPEFVRPTLFEKPADRVYASAIFEKTYPLCREVKRLYPDDPRIPHHPPIRRQARNENPRLRVM